MKKIILVLVLVLGLSFTSYAANVSLEWLPEEGATGYRIYKSEDLGVTWDAGIDVEASTSIVYQDVREDAMVLFKVSAYNDSGESVAHWRGCWYDHRLMPVGYPSGLGVQ